LRPPGLGCSFLRANVTPVDRKPERGSSRLPITEADRTPDGFLLALRLAGMTEWTSQRLPTASMLHIIDSPAALDSKAVPALAD